MSKASDYTVDFHQEAHDAFSSPFLWVWQLLGGNYLDPLLQNGNILSFILHLLASTVLQKKTLINSWSPEKPGKLLYFFPVFFSKYWVWFASNLHRWPLRGLFFFFFGIIINLYVWTYLMCFNLLQILLYWWSNYSLLCKSPFNLIPESSWHKSSSL